jgi:hypothetical protein
VLTEDLAAMPDDVALAWRFTRATIDHDPLSTTGKTWTPTSAQVVFDIFHK